jgi:hypothetical protein
MASWDELLFLGFLAFAVLGFVLTILSRNDYQRIAESQGGSYLSITREIAKRRPIVGNLLRGVHSSLLLFAIAFVALRLIGSP